MSELIFDYTYVIDSVITNILKLLIIILIIKLIKKGAKNDSIITSIGRCKELSGYKWSEKPKSGIRNGNKLQNK